MNDGDVTYRLGRCNHSPMTAGIFRRHLVLSVVMAVLASLAFSGVSAVAGKAPTASAASQDGFVPIVQTKLVDTRDGTGLPEKPLAGGSTYSFAVGGQAGIPTSGVVAVSINILAVNSTTSNYINVWATGGTK